jgi:hypothetical protein
MRRALPCCLLPLLAACTIPPSAEVPNEWFTGTSTVDPAAVSLFGPSGPVAIVWMLFPLEGRWAWLAAGPGAFNEEIAMVRVAGGPDSDGRAFWAGDATGRWSGSVAVTNDPEFGILPPRDWSYDLALTDGSGRITGRGSLDSDTLRVHLHWLRPDGSTVGSLQQVATGTSLEAYNAYLARHGIAPPPSATDSATPPTP